MKSYIYQLLWVPVVAVGAISCSEEQGPAANETGAGKMEFAFSHPDATKATETSFEKNDAVGVFVTESGKKLEISGNVVNNEKFEFDGSTWKSSRPLYWNDGTFDAYAVYPYLSDINSITDFEFEVNTDQRGFTGGMSNYEASDLLFAHCANVVGSSNPLVMQFKHIMSKVTIRLVKGEDYDGELPESADVTILNTVTKASVDIESGVATRDIYGTKKTVFAKQISPNSYTAVLVPQRIDNIVPLIEVSTQGVSYLFESRLVLKPGTNHILNLVIDNNPNKVKIEIGGETVKWN